MVENWWGAVRRVFSGVGAVSVSLKVALWVVAALLAVLGSSVLGGAYASRSAISPRVGDWEGVTRGFPVSFVVVRDSRGGVPGYLPFGFEDLVVVEPANCSLQPSVSNQGLFSEGAPTVYR